MDIKKIGWIGLGNMGIPMAKNLLKAGLKVFVYNRTKEKAQALAQAGASVTDTANELSQQSDIIFTMLPDDASVIAVFDNLLKENVTGKLFINMSTISPSLALQLSLQCKKANATYLDAPVSGSVKPATDATLLVLAAGNRSDYDTALPYFEKLGKLSLFLGEAGQGSKAKLAINYYMSVVIEGIAETVLFAKKNGIEKETMMNIINESACGSPMSAMKTASILSNNYPSAFPLKYMLKDIRLASDCGLNTSVAKAMKETYQQAFDANLGDEDLMAVIKAIKI